MRKIKSIVAIIMAMCLIIGCTACSSDNGGNSEKNETKVTEAAKNETKDEKEKSSDKETASDKKDDDVSEQNTDSSDDVVDEPGDDTDEIDDTADDEPVKTVFANGIYINEEGIYCNPDGTTVDLGGMEITLADWFSKEPAEPSTAYEEATQDYRDYIQETYNFKIGSKKLSGYGTYLENFTSFATSGGDENYVFCMDNSFLTKPMLSDLFYDLAKLDVFDFDEEKWNSSITYMTRMGDSVYGMRAEATEPRGGVFWNKRLFQEAGIDPDLPYDLQAKNEWNWTTFEDLCKQLTRDTDNDGVANYWAMTSFSGDIMNAAIASNGAQLIDRDENGNFYLAANSEEFLEAYDWISYMRQNYEMPSKSNGGEIWDYMYGSFMDAEAAMIVTEEYKAPVFNEGMDDDYGFVMFPHGPKVDECVGYSKDNTYVIPSCYDEDRAWKIAFAYNLYTEPTPGYDEDDDWKAAYYTRYRDERAVDETLELMRTHQRALIYPLVPKANSDNEYYWNIDSETGAERYEIKKDEYQSFIDAVQAK